MVEGPKREHTFVFDDEARALLFVRRLCLTLAHLAIYREGRRVRVIDGSDGGQGSEIARLAKMSGFVPEAPR